MGAAMTKALILATCFLLAATLGACIALYAGWPTGVLTAAVGFVFTLQIRGGFARRKDKRAIARELAGLRRMGLEMEQALSHAHAKMEAMSKSIEARTSAQRRKIVGELQVLESLMREFAGKISNSARQQPAGPVREIPAQGPARAYVATMGGADLLETIRTSLEQNRVDLYLQPIVSLPQRKLRFYEALSRLRAEDGSLIMPAQYIAVAAPAGLMSVVDNLLLFRCVQIVRRLTQKHRDIAVFCNISGDTLNDGEFFPQFLEYMQTNRDLAGQIVFEFSQDAVLQAGPQGEQNLILLSNLGFALSMDHVETLALDFVKLKAMGFRHLKVRAATLIRGMNDAHAVVAAEDFKSLLERHGLNLIAERVEDEKAVVQLLDYAVDFAQGYLFGEPRAVRDDGVRPVEKEPVPPSVVPMRRAG
jgi:cyclic-di-GMP phosphodiesterase TipF (flagellum assembly factor)